MVASGGCRVAIDCRVVCWCFHEQLRFREYFLIIAFTYNGTHINSVRGV